MAEIAIKLDNKKGHRDERRSEKIAGKIVKMASPGVSHDAVVISTSNIFFNYLDGKKCKVYANVDVFLTEEDTFVPDMVVVCNPEIIKENGIHGAPDLVVEVLSPSTAKNDKSYKKTIYGKCGVKEYWIVDIKSRAVEVYLLNGTELELTEIYSIYPDFMLQKMTEEERNKVMTEFSPSMFSDLTVTLDDVFRNIDF